MSGSKRGSTPCIRASAKLTHVKNTGRQGSTQGLQYAATYN